MAGKKQGFEEAMKRLEEIVDELGKESFSLEESIKKFEEGLKLGNKCRALLEKAEAKIKLLVEDEGGTLSEKDATDEFEK